jgi:uncharacterized membrane protein HdeD (DUF308 family)
MAQSQDPTNVRPFSRGQHSLGEAIVRIRHKWGWFVAFGALTALLGLATLGYLVVVGTIASVYMIGLAMIVAGGVEIGVGFKAKSWGWAAAWILAGLLYVVAGAFAFARPLDAAIGFTFILGAILVVTGLVRIFAAFRLEHGPKTMLMVAGIVTTLLGAMILASWPASGLFVLGTFLGIDLLFYGISWIAFGLRLKSL